MIDTLRWVTDMLDQDGDPGKELMIAAGVELLATALKDPRDKPDTLQLIRREVTAIGKDIDAYRKAQADEFDILSERLFRLFDPALAWNEAINRAIERKKEMGETLDPRLTTMSPQQEFMFERQQRLTRNALRAAWRHD